MAHAKLISNGGSQAVRLPKEFRFEGTEVEVSKIGSIVLLAPLDNEWAGIDQAIAIMGADFMEDGRTQDALQERASL